MLEQSYPWKSAAFEEEIADVQFLRIANMPDEAVCKLVEGRYTVIDVWPDGNCAVHCMNIVTGVVPAEESNRGGKKKHKEHNLLSSGLRRELSTYMRENEDLVQQQASCMGFRVKEYRQLAKICRKPREYLSDIHIAAFAFMTNKDVCIWEFVEATEEAPGFIYCTYLIKGNYVSLRPTPEDLPDECAHFIHCYGNHWALG